MEPETPGIHANNEKLTQYLLSSAMRLRSQRNLTPPAPSPASNHPFPSTVTNNHSNGADMTTPPHTSYSLHLSQQAPTPASSQNSPRSQSQALARGHTRYPSQGVAQASQYDSTCHNQQAPNQYPPQTAIQPPARVSPYHHQLAQDPVNFEEWRAAAQSASQPTLEALAQMGVYQTATLPRGQGPPQLQSQLGNGQIALQASPQVLSCPPMPPELQALQSLHNYNQSQATIPQAPQQPSHQEPPPQGFWQAQQGGISVTLPLPNGLSYPPFPAGAQVATQFTNHNRTTSNTQVPIQFINHTRTSSQSENVAHTIFQSGNQSRIPSQPENAAHMPTQFGYHTRTLSQTENATPIPTQFTNLSPPSGRLENAFDISTFLHNIPSSPRDPITLARYSPSVFSAIDAVLVAHAILNTRISTSTLKPLFGFLFRKHNVTLQFGIDLVHRHWDMPASTRLIHIDSVYWLWPFAENSRAGGTVHPIAWVMSGGMVYPYEFAFVRTGRQTPPSVGHYPDFVREYFAIVRGLGLEGVLGLRLVPYQTDYPNNNTCVHWLHDSKPLAVPECANFEPLALQRAAAMANKKGLPELNGDVKVANGVEGEELPFQRVLDDFLEKEFPGQTLAENMMDAFWFFHEPHGHRMYRCWCWNGLG